jgi:hypothetical protein
MIKKQIIFEFGVERFMLGESRSRARGIWLISEDGLWDICIGLLLFGFGLTISIDQIIWLIGVFVLVYFVILMAGKEAITRPRINNFDIQESQLVNFSLVTGADILILILILGVSGATFVKFEGLTSIGFIEDYALLILGILLSILLIQFGFILTDGFRFYLYAGMVLLAFSICQALSWPVIPVLYIVGAIFTFIGLFYLVRFINSYPKSGAQGDKSI